MYKAWGIYCLRRVGQLTGACVLAALLVVGGPALAQQDHAPAPEAAPQQELMALTLPENMELSLLVDLVSRQLGINILYDEQIRGRQVTIKAATKVPRESLLPLLESALRMKGFLLVHEEGQPGWRRITAAQNLPGLAAPAVVEEGAAGDAAPGAAVTRVFQLRHAGPQRVEELVRPFLSSHGANAQPVAERNLLIVTDLASNLPRVERIVSLVDQAPGEVAVRFVHARNMEAAQLARQVTEIAAARARLAGAAADMGKRLESSVDDRTNRVVFLGSESDILAALRLAEEIDVPLPLRTQVYQLRSASPERIDQLARGLLEPAASQRLYRSSIDREGGVLVVTTTSETHEAIERLRVALDVPLREEQSPVRFYKLANATAADVLAVIRSLQGSHGLDTVAVEPGASPAPAQGFSGTRGVTPAPTPAGADPPEQPLASALEPAQRAVETGEATVTADPNTNSIIVVAKPETHRVFEHLISMLDRRRPQVLVEVTLVTIDTSGGYSVGVEVSVAGSAGDADLLSFSSFGLGRVDPRTGALRLRPGVGFNGSVISSDVADMVVRALATDRRSRITSAPRVLVNDNATGTLESVNEQPFISTNASDTVATTSFGGFVEAGTTVTVTPHISEGDHLVLEYEVSLNSFTGEGGAGIPPPRTTNALRSVVTVPDGHTIIVGGLARTDDTFTKQSVPLLGSIPLLEYLASNRTKTRGETTLFAFIRPTILRDDAFADLKYLSGLDVSAAGLPGDAPSSEPMLLY